MIELGIISDGPAALQEIHAKPISKDPYPLVQPISFVSLMDGQITFKFTTYLTLNTMQNIQMR